MLKKFGVEMIGARAEVIDKAEDRELFREAMNKIGLETPRSRLADAGALKRADRQKYKDEIARIEAAHADRKARAEALAAFEADWARHESERRRRYVEKGLIEALDALPDIGLPPSSAPPSRSAAPAAASPITARSFWRSSSAGSTPRRPARC